MREEVKESFDETSPITGQLSVLVEDAYRLDLSTGFQNMKDEWIESKPEILESVEQQMPDYIKKFKFIDTTGNVWYPMLAFKHSGVLFPISDNDGTFKWAVSTVEKLRDKEDINTHFVINLPVLIEGKEEMGLFKVNNTPKLICDQLEFEKAFDLYNSLEYINEDDEK